MRRADRLIAELKRLARRRSAIDGRRSRQSGIADRLSIGFTTGARTRQHILEKLDAHSKLEAVARAAKYALLSR